MTQTPEEDDVETRSPLLTQEQAAGNEEVTHVVGAHPALRGDKVTALGSTYRVKTDGSHVAMAYSVMEEEFWGDTTPLHSHPGAEETFYVLGGEVEVWADGVVFKASAGAFMSWPGECHTRCADCPMSRFGLLTLISPPASRKSSPRWPTKARTTCWLTPIGYSPSRTSRHVVASQCPCGEQDLQHNGRADPTRSRWFHHQSLAKTRGSHRQEGC